MTKTFLSLTLALLAGQAPGTKSSPVPPHARKSVRYRFTYVGGTSPGGGGTGGNP